MVVTDAVKPLAVAFAVALDAQNVAAFAVDLSPTGLPPATHWWDSHPLTAGHVAAIAAAVDGYHLGPEAIQLFPEGEKSPDQVLAMLSLRRIELGLPNV